MDSNDLAAPESFFALDDITIKKIAVPETIPVWGGKSMYIKQLSRATQDAYLRRQFGTTKMKQDPRMRQQEISIEGIFGHDSWLCVRGICDQDGKPIFKKGDEPKLDEKSGEAIGWIASEILKFSGMDDDDKVVKGEATSDEALKEEIKNS